jgi:predicted transcriptional regulator
MPQKPHEKVKQKREPFLRVPKLFLYRFWMPKGERHVPRRSAVFNDAGLFYIKSYEHIHDFYIRKFDGRGPLITPAEAMIYSDILLMTSRGNAFTVAQYAADLGLYRTTISRALDTLENVGLIHRERSVDGSEGIYIVVPHTPLPPDELRRQYAKILERLDGQHIQKKRAAAGRKMHWAPKAFSWKRLLRSFDGNYDKAEKFETIVGDIVHQHITDKYYSRPNFIRDVEEWCARFNVSITEKHYGIAFEIKEYIERIV